MGRAHRRAAVHASSARRASFLAEASRVLTASLDYETTLAAVARLAVPALADACVVDILEDEKIRRLAVAHEAPEAERIAQELLRRYPPRMDGPHPLAQVLRTGRSALHPEIDEAMLEALAQDEAHLALIRGLGIRSAIVVALMAHGHILGAISLVSTSARRFGPRDLALAEELARHAGLAVDNARLYREAQEANGAKDEFLANLSHELRNPLNAILGWTQMLRRLGPLPPPATRALEAIERNTRLQAHLIEDLLDVSRIVTGKLSVEVAPVDLAAIVAAAEEDTRLAAEARGIRLSTHLEPLLVSGDAGRLHQVVVNLVGNAVKFTDPGGWVEIQLSRKGTAAELRVIDSGRGIEPALLPHVFERFRQGGGQYRPGLGLGLAIVHSIVALHCGVARADSAGTGKGATFTVTLPLLDRA